MHILLTGGTGLLGRALCAALLADGHQLSVLSRRPHKVAALCGPGVQALVSLDDWLPDMHFDAVINLAGAPIIDLPWTTARKQTLWASRITLTEQLVTALQRAERKPAVLLSGSAIGIYGDCAEAPCSDSAAVPNPAPADFAAQLCAAWETAARQASTPDTRVSLLRTGLVLAPHGGLLARMRLPFRLGLGARLGDGQQWMSWIHLDDWVAAVLHLLAQPDAHGACNLTAPQPVRNADFSAALANCFGRRVHLAAPASVLRLLLGQRAGLLLDSQRVLPDRLLATGYAFRHPELRSALQSLS
ncbi:TIGR01777 family oxidoreductase [Uliginosibacterium sp. 31-16]|uniref:TIGR01777 family oxidoreductase n=1 Tax=Uliginosibacterium sp. 31-16 TaxID=3068315 RepID=UPI00273D49FB|nr:TIGR01777 family oxidoreductase [Uliginosibacterium sp. 31-16]MDP5239753.1 TIGR01777 family oxidoreductase [Uliginosibacterium sp. 31-16]